MSVFLQDLRYSSRVLARNPGFSVAVVLILAIALGANTAVFSVVNGVLLRALPYPEPDQIMDVSVLLPPSEARPGHKDFLDNQTLEIWKKTSGTLAYLATYRTRLFTLSGQGNPERLSGVGVSASLFPLLRVTPVKGRTFDEEELQPGHGRVVILSHALWLRRFLGTADVIGKVMTLDGAPHTIVGVMPKSFFFPDHDVELWVPLDAAGGEAGNVIDVQYLPAVARLKDGVPPERAEAEAQGILRSMERSASVEDSGEGKVRLVPLRDELASEVRPALLVMATAVGLVLLMACINLASLLLARNPSRQREMAIRSAVGGSRGRLVRQLLTESLLLSFAGGVAGLFLAVWLHRLLPKLLPSEIPRIEDVHLDTPVLLFAAFLTGMTGLLFGLIPALRAAGSDLVRPLQGNGTEGSPGLASRGWFVVPEIALAFVLLAGAGLLLRSFLQLVAVDPGFLPSHVVSATLDLSTTQTVAPNRRGAFFNELLDRLGEQEGVAAAGLASFPPLSPGFALTSLTVVGQPPARTMAVPQLTSPGYLQAMGLRLAEGRWISPQDHASRIPVAVVNETFSRRYLKDLRPIGHRLIVGSAEFEIVGVVEDMRLLGLATEPKPELYVSYLFSGAISGGDSERLTLVMRTDGEPSAWVPLIRALVVELAPDVALEDVRPMNSRLAASVAEPRFYALVLSAFAGMALLLAVAGLYGVLSSFVSQQTRAIGIRRALGAQRRNILAMVLRRGLSLTFIGLVIGIAAAVGATRVLAHLLFGITPSDPLVYGVAALSLAGIAGLACYLPARRATSVEPREALR